MNISRLIDSYEFKNPDLEQQLHAFYKNFDPLFVVLPKNPFSLYIIFSTFFKSLGGKHPEDIIPTSRIKKDLQLIINQHSPEEIESTLLCINLDFLLYNHPEDSFLSYPQAPNLTKARSLLYKNVNEDITLSRIQIYEMYNTLSTIFQKIT